MQRLLPHDGDEIDPAAAIAAEPRTRVDGRPWVLANMVAAPDGTIAVDGRSAPLGGPGDRAVFRALRSIADVVLVGAGTARAERYRLPATVPGAPARAGRPALCVVSASLDLPLDLPFLDHHLTDRAGWPLVATVEAAPAAARAALAEVADVVVAGEERVEPHRVVAELGRRGHRTVLCEGGPTLLAQLADADLIDEWDLTIAPWMLGGGEGNRLLGHPMSEPRPLRLDRVLHDGDHLFARYLRG